jgi:hypothetical protein
MCPTLTFKGEQDVLEGNNMKKMHQTYGFEEQKIQGENSISFFICHYACDRGGISVEQRRSRTRPRQHHTHVSLVVVVTYEDVLQEDFGSGIPSIENSYLQTGNSKQQPTNRNATTTLRLTGEWGMTEAQSQSWMQNPYRANCNNRSNCGCRTPTLQS